MIEGRNTRLDGRCLLHHNGWADCFCARYQAQYTFNRKRENHPCSDNAPKGFVGLVEMFVMMVYDDLIKPSIGEKHCKPYAPFLLTAFFFIFITNLMGLIPVFPGGANVTGNITITFFLAFCVLLIVNIFGNKASARNLSPQ